MKNDKKMKQLLIVAALAGVGVGMLAMKLVGGNGHENSALAEKQTQPNQGLGDTLVQFQEVKLEDVKEIVPMTGKLTVDSLRLQQISARVPGRVDRLAMVEGQTVKAGQALGWIYSPEYISAQNEFLLAKRTAKTLNTDATRDLYEDAKQTLDSARNKLRIVGASHQEIEQLETKGAAAELLTITAAINGVITKRAVDVGSYLNTGDNVGTVADLSSLWFMGNVFEADLPKLKLGQVVDIEILGALAQRHQGKVSFISPTFDPQTHTVSIRVDIPNTQGELKPDMFAKANVAIGIKKLPIVPKNSVVQDGAQSFVVIKKSDGKYQRAPVSTMPGNDAEHLAIIAGVEAGDSVVIEGGVLVDRSLVNANKLNTTTATGVAKP